MQLIHFHHNQVHTPGAVPNFSFHLIFRRLQKDFDVRQAFLRLGFSSRMLLLTTSVQSFGLGLGSIFLNIFLWRQYSDLGILVIFNLIQFPMIAVVYLLASTSTKPIALKRLLQMGILFYISCFALIILVQNQTINFLIPIGLLYGAGTGAYWTGANNFLYLSTQDQNRDDYNGLSAATGYFLSILTPLLAGVVLSLGLFTNGVFGNYYLLFFSGVVVLVIAFLTAYRLPATALKRVGWSQITTPLNNPLWRLVNLAIVIDGFKGASEGLIGAVLIFQILPRELDIGLYNSFFSLISVFIALRLAIWLNHANRLRVGLIGSILMFLSALIYAGFFSFPGLIIASVVSLLAGPLFGISLASTFFDVIDHEADAKETYSRFTLLRELSLFVGRSLGALLFLLFLTMGNDLLLAKIWLVFLGSLNILYFYIIQKYEARLPVK